MLSLSVLCRRRDLQKPNSIEVLSAFLERGADLRCGFGASEVEGSEGKGMLSPLQGANAFRLSSIRVSGL